jgi:hypothetical protein
MGKKCDVPYLLPSYFFSFCFGDFQVLKKGLSSFLLLKRPWLLPLPLPLLLLLKGPAKKIGDPLG